MNTAPGARLISESEFLAEIRGFRSGAFHFEGQPSYALGYERADFERFLAGNPAQPTDLDWYRPWLERVRRWTSEGKSVGRVRVIEEPPTDYQRWLLWNQPWHAAAGEDIRYIARSLAGHLGLPLDHDWWLLDDQCVIVTRFTDDGQVLEKILIADPHDVGEYIHWRDVAVRHAERADRIVAA